MVKSLLLGSTGHGKSALGNFLVDPTLDHIWENRTFPVGESLESCTRKCSLGSSEEVVVMDTPGLNESHQKDLPNMIQIVKAAQELGQAHAIMLVMKMDSRIDQNYKETISYYYQLLGQKAFESNLILVLTNFRQNDRKYRGESGEALLETISNQSGDDVKDHLGLKDRPPVFFINSQPDDEKDLEFHLQIRYEILNRARSNPYPADLLSLKVPKTAGIRQQHAEEAKRLEGIIEAKEKEKAKRESLLPSTEAIYQDLGHRVEDAEDNIRKSTARIKELDTKELVDLLEKPHETNVEQGVGKGGPNRQGWPFIIPAPCTIRNIQKGGSYLPCARYIETVRAPKRLEGRWERAVFKSHAKGKLTIQLQGYSRDFHQEEIAQLEKDVQQKEKAKEKALQKREEIEEKHRELLADGRELQDEITKLKEQKAEFESSHFSSIEAAEKEAASYGKDLFARSKL